MPEDNGNWDSCKMFVLNELKRMNDILTDLDRDINGIANQMTALKVKVGLIGGVAGAILGAVFAVIGRLIVK